MAPKKFKFTNPNTGIEEERPDTEYFRNLAKKIQEKYNKLSDKQKAAIKDRISKRKSRQADTDKKKSEVKQGRASGLTMTEIRAKRMNISADDLKKRQVATLIGMAEGMSLFIPGGVAIKAGQLAFRGKKGKDAIQAIKNIVQGKKVKQAPATKTAAKKQAPKTKTQPKQAAKKAAPKTQQKKAAKKAAPKTATQTRTKTKQKQAAKKAAPKKTITQRIKENKGPIALGAAVIGGASLIGGTKSATGPAKAEDKKRPQRPKPDQSIRKKRPQRPKPDQSIRKDQSKRPKRPAPDQSIRKPVAKPDTNISAGKGTGFGPKGNIFPSNDAERKRLMDMYGGTGSAAAKAAMRGTQGNLRKRKGK